MAIVRAKSAPTNRLGKDIQKLANMNTFHKNAIFGPAYRPKPVDGVFWDIERDGITQSMIDTFRQCPMKAQLRLKEGLQHINKPSHELDFGSIFHSVVESVYTQRMRKPKFSWEKLGGDVLEAIYRDFEDLDPADHVRFDVTHGLCSLVLSEYFQWWHKRDTNLKIIATEEEFAFPYRLRCGKVILIRGKIDLIEEKNSRELWVWDHKTKDTIEVSGNYSVGCVCEKMDYELQMGTYGLAIKHKYGRYPSGVVYNLVKRPGQEFKGSYNRKPENMEQYFARVKAHMDENSSPRERKHAYFLRYDVSLTRQAFEEFAERDLRYWVERIWEWSQDNSPSARNSSACAVYRKPCEYLRVCSENDRSPFIQRDLVFPELEKGNNNGISE